MNIVILLVLSSVLAASVFLVAFLWANANGQYDDLHTPAIRILFDDQPSVVDRTPTDIHSITTHGT
ncbi:MAG: cbb3-type cytochrome oxidase assembly protein CcoS [Bacteroidota bacterium]|nr:cbb3-type cytochrome oxidase assembly protein CcoS [Bacteroidota bacterium]MDP4232430.1 cbb3-type cytochrome oxidase assembly protein CcoS [Bacteroidota bacterium]MDP4241566.1 cbb3-type cytochrome oxidase assembly protein CcoS [Bacteroidota bacterium]MDP4286310.1 cbb3-type cytochrome oxidase assembly protein CcoS [Bacteroidota bacterium]